MLSVGLLIYGQDLNFQPELAKEVNRTSWHWAFGETDLWYILLNTGTLLFPFLLSFDRKVHFYKKWRYLFPSIIFVGAFFLAWDVYFTKQGVWGFNSDYYYTTFLGLPIGEWLFFITVPYACLFIYECLISYFSTNFLAKADRWINISLVLFFTAVGFWHHDKAYTGWTFMLASAMVLTHFLLFENNYRTRFYMAYLISVVPFILVNGALTGAFNEAPVVLYNDAHNLSSALGTRLITIPFDDLVYSFLLLMMNVTLYEGFRGQLKWRKPPE